MKRILVIFAKEPDKDTVKTRLKDCLSEPQRLDLYKAFLKDTIDIAKKVKCEKRIIAYESEGRAPRYLRKIAPSGSEFYEQKGEDLGVKMYNTFQAALQKGASQTVIMGSDAPTLPARYIDDSFRRLDESDAVIGPSRDGGYYLIGIKALSPGLFDGVKWSRNAALSSTVKNFRRLDKKVALLDTWFDVDDADSLLYLKKSLKNGKDKKSGKWTRKVIDARAYAIGL